MTVLALLGGLLCACAAPDGAGGAASPSPSPTPASTTVLAITVTSSPTAPARPFTLSCQPATGTLSDPAAACAFVAKSVAALLAPVPADRACTMVFGGADVATIKGTWRGTPVDARLARNNGCEIARWDKLKVLIGEGGS